MKKMRRRLAPCRSIRRRGTTWRRYYFSFCFWTTCCDASKDKAGRGSECSPQGRRQHKRCLSPQYMVQQSRIPCLDLSCVPSLRCPHADGRRAFALVRGSTSLDGQFVHVSKSELHTQVLHL